jgi:hypothetical protein
MTVCSLKVRIISRCVCEPHHARPLVSRDIVHIPNSKNTNLQIAYCYNIPYLSGEDPEGFSRDAQTPFWSRII